MSETIRPSIHSTQRFDGVPFAKFYKMIGRIRDTISRVSAPPPGHENQEGQADREEVHGGRLVNGR